MKLLSLFSGIGAFEKALDNLKVLYELVGFSEIDKYATQSYCAIHNVPESMNLGDITKVDEKALPQGIDLITYGFPCQDISIAGKQKGLINEDGTQTRSGLFFEALRIIEATKPRVAIAENVKNLVSKKFNAQFQVVLESLEQAGYNNYWQVLNAKDYGIPQNRERVFIVSIRKDIDTGCFRFPDGFPLELRLKDLLEEEVDEKYYLSKKLYNGLLKHKEYHKTKGNGFGANFNDPETVDVRATISARYYKDGSECLIEEPQVKQIGNCCPTKTRENPNQGRIYDAEGLAPCLNQMGGGNRQPFVTVKEATKIGYAEAYEGDSINLEQPNSKTRRGMVGHGVAQTLTTSPQQAVVESVERTPLKFLNRNQKNIEGDYAFCIDTAHTGGIKENMSDGTLRIRKLTPKECFRLMGFDDSDFEKAEAANSNTQLYKQAGNSICVPVPERIIEALIDCGAISNDRVIECV